MLNTLKYTENPDIRVLEKQKLIDGSRGKIFGMLNEGDVNNKRDTLVVMSPGFHVTHRGRTFSKLVYELKDMNIPTYRYDYYGRGMSEGNDENLKYSLAVASNVAGSSSTSWPFFAGMLISCTF